ncbi:MAG: LPS-assembly protein LptD [Alphaproteobacteria bacterium MarineAlpha5_Bin9]|nr:MAG: LPS-assembly protein LptD [Alphaproteobacteria bacterium MarineAlpha5_Bin9]|tara:strand:+ start:9928 stop:12141 length:2214 start_codon:yes stop_codon:yes gene_type:complete
MKKFFYIIIFLLSISFSYTSNNLANETEVYADNIEYDSNDRIIATGKVKIIKDDQVLTSNKVIIDQVNKKIILPEVFQFKDEQNTYYQGSSGQFTTDFTIGKVHDIRIMLKDGSRIVGNLGLKENNQDLITKGVFSPCTSKIKIRNFMCPIWQIDGEQILHDRDNLFIHTKHAKMRIINTPVYYFPYIVQPSPLRVKRKSGFLNPSINFNFLDTKITQSISLPYYFAIDEDKELLLTPTINYGGGVDASQKINYQYKQVLSGGTLGIDASTQTNLENENNESWLRDGSIQTNLKQNINKNYRMELSSAFQTSPTYLRRTDQNNILNRKNSLNSTLNIFGYDIINKNDYLEFNISGYQVVRNNEDNKTTPTSFPYIKYTSNNKSYQNYSYKNHYNYYNIFRDKATNEHAQQQQKVSYALKANNEFYRFNSKLNFKTEIHTQFYNTENMKIDNKDYSGTYERIFPMTGLYIETPLYNKKNDFYIIPKLFGVLNSSQSNSNKISNEDSTDYSYSLLNFADLNRFKGSDKLDNSKRLSYGIDFLKNNYSFGLGQSYEFDINRNDFTKNVGQNDYMSDLLGSASIDNIKNDLYYNFRFNVDQGLMKSHNLKYINESIIGKFELLYSQERQEVNKILKDENENLKLTLNSAEFLKYSNIKASSEFNLITDDPTNYSLGYEYFDECFGVNLDFSRNFYEDRDLKPSDTITLMFSFKHLGSYSSSNVLEEKIYWDYTKKDASKFK